MTEDCIENRGSIRTFLDFTHKIEITLRAPLRNFLILFRKNLSRSNTGFLQPNRLRMCGAMRFRVHVHEHEFLHPLSNLIAIEEGSTYSYILLYHLIIT